MNHIRYSVNHIQEGTLNPPQLIIYLRHQFRGRRPRLWEPAGDVSPLDLVRDWAIKAAADLQVSAVFHAWSEPDNTHFEIARLGITPIAVEAASQLEAIAMAAEQIPPGYLVCVEPGAALLPATLLLEGLARLDDADAVAVAGLPMSLSPLFFRSSVLTALHAIGAASLFQQTPEEQQIAFGRWLRAGTEPTAPFKVILLEPPCPIAAPAFDAYSPRHLQQLEASLRLQEPRRLKSWVEGLEVESTPVFLRQSGQASTAGLPRILLFSRSPGYSGAEECLANLAGYLGRRRVELLAVTGLPDAVSARLKHSCGAVMTLDGELDGETPESRRTAGAIFKDGAPDVIHFNGFTGESIFAEALSIGVPIVQHVHTYRCDLMLGQLRQADVVVAVSDFVARRVAELAPHAKVVTLYNGIDIERFKPAPGCKVELRARFGLPPKAYVVVVIGRYSTGKRYDVMIESALQAARAIPELVLVLLADPHTGPSVYRDARRRLKDFGVFLSWLPDTAPLLQACDALLHCGEEDAFPTCVLEAMACGVPVVAANSGGIPEQIRDRETGILVKPGDTVQFASALQKLALEPLYRQRLVVNARREIEMRFDSRAWANSFLDIYESLTRSKRRRN